MAECRRSVSNIESQAISVGPNTHTQAEPGGAVAPGSAASIVSETMNSQ